MKELKIGDKFKPKRSRKEYTIVAKFEDNGEIFYVAKTSTYWGGSEYRHIFTFDKDGKLYKHI